MKNGKSIVCALIMVLVLCSCGGNTVSKEQYDAVCAERDALQEQLASATTTENSGDAESTSVTVNICGNFVGRVKDLIPDYCLDASTPQVAIVTQFQSMPFAVYVGDLAKQLEADKAYVFTLKTKESVEILKTEYREGALDPAQMIPYYNMQVESVREATADEAGLDGGMLKYELVK